MKKQIFFLLTYALIITGYLSNAQGKIIPTGIYFTVVTSSPDSALIGQAILINYTVVGPGGGILKINSITNDNLNENINIGKSILPPDDPPLFTIKTDFYIGTDGNNCYRHLKTIHTNPASLIQSSTQLNIPNDIIAGKYYLVAIVGNKVNKVPIKINNESLYITNIILDRKRFNPGENLLYSFEVSGELLNSNEIMVEVEIIYEDNTSSIIEKKVYNSYNQIISGNYNLPETKYGITSLLIKVNKYYNSTIQLTPQSTNLEQFTINYAEIYAFNHVTTFGKPITLIYNNESIQTRVIVNNKSNSKPVKVSTYWSDFSVFNSILDDHYYIKSCYPSYLNIIATSEVREIGAWDFHVDPVNSNLDCPSSGLYVLWTLVINNNTGEALEYLFEYFVFNKENSRPVNKSDSNILDFAGLSNNYPNIFDDFRIYPNPSNGIFNIDLPLIETNNSTIEVYTLAGSKVYSQKITEASNQINLQHLNTGTYLLKLNKDGILYTEKIQIRK